MKNSKPFEILLDFYNKECAILYDIVKHLMNYPSIQPNDDLEGKLFASALASICSDYLEMNNNMLAHQDFPLFVAEMDFDNGDFEFFKKGLTSKTLNFVPESFDEMVFAIIQDYKKTIKSDLRNLFQTDQILMQLFSAIYSFNNADFMPEMTVDSVAFFADFKK